MNKGDKKHYKDQRRAEKAKQGHAVLSAGGFVVTGLSLLSAGGSVMKLSDLYSASAVEMEDDEGNPTIKLVNPSGSTEMVEVLDAQGLCHEVGPVNTCESTDMGLVLAGSLVAAFLSARFGIKRLKRSVEAAIQEKELSPTRS